MHFVLFSGHFFANIGVRAGDKRRMIIAIILVDHSAGDPGSAPYFQGCATTPAADGKTAETRIEHVTRTVLRGPFGVTLVAALPAFQPKLQELLKGFTVQHLELKPAASPQDVLREALAAAREARARWEKAMRGAQARFTGEPEEAGPPVALKKSPDVKIRALARSFERDAVMLFRGDEDWLSPEAQARMVEAFAREGARGPAARPLAVALRQGVRGYPVLLATGVADEAGGLSAAADFEAWLAQQGPRVLEVAV